jgi:hypothetical protein
MHDFSADDVVKGAGPLKYLAALALLAVLASLTMVYINMKNLVVTNVLVNEGSEQIIITKNFKDHTETTTVDFSKIERLELVMGGSRYTWEVRVVDLAGTTHLIREDDKPLRSYAQHISTVIGKRAGGNPIHVKEIKKLKGFGD